MSMKRAVSVAAVAAGVGISAVTLNAGPAYSAPLDPPPPCPNCHGGPNPGGPGGQQGSPGGQQGGAPAGGSPNQQAPQTHEPSPGGQTNAPANTPNTPPPSEHGPSNNPPGGQNTEPANTPNTPPPNEHSPSNNPPGGQTSEPANRPNTPPSEHGPSNPPGGQTSEPASRPSTPPPSGRQATPALNPPSTQPPHPAYVPRGTYDRPTAQVGGPVDARVGFSFSVPDHGAPPPPPPRGFGWNDGPAPGHPPPNWDGPPPPGGWDGPPPPGGWNRPWAGPPRDVAVAQVDFGPFAYDTFTVIPVFNWQFGGWGYWFFGVWIPLY